MANKKYEQNINHSKSKYDIKTFNNIKLLIKNEQYEQALVETEDYIEKYPRDLEGKFQYANIIYRMGYVDKAKAVYKDLSKKEGKTKYNSLNMLALIEFNNKNYDKAKEYLNYCLSISPFPEISCYIRLSNIELKQNNISESLKILEQCPEKDNANIIIHRSHILIKIGEIEEARMLLASLKAKGNIELQRQIYFAKGIVERSAECYYKAYDYYQKAMKGIKNNLYWKINTELASLEMEYNHFDSSEQLCETIIKNNKAFKQSATIIKINVLIKKANFEEAEQLCMSMINDCEVKERVYFYLGLIYFNKKQYELSKQSYMESRKSIIMEKESDFNIALCLYKQGMYNEAYEIVEKLDTENDYELKKVKDLKLELDRLKILLYLKLNKKDQIKINNYVEIQLVDYSVERAIRHIDRVHIDKDNSSRFNENIDIKELINLTPILLEKAELVQNNLFEVYEVIYDKIGYENEEIVNKLKIVINPETNEVITMFPKGDITFHEQKVKRKSQIEKFYDRYGIK